MEELRAQLVAMGVKVEGMPDDQVKQVARALKIPVTVPRKEPSIQEHKGAKYVVTDNFVVPGRAEGKAGTARNLFLRIEALPQAIADLQFAQELLKKQQ